MTAQRQAARTSQRHDSDMPYGNETLLRQHTIASITLEAGVDKRTVQRWVAKCGEIGILRNGTRHFSDAERIEILSHQSKPKQAEESIEAELIEPGTIELHTSEANAAAPLVAFDLSPIQLDIPTSDIAALEENTAQLEEAAQQGAIALNQYFAARMETGLAQIAAEQDNLLKGIRANALNVGARSILEGKQL